MTLTLAYPPTPSLATTQCALSQLLAHMHNSLVGVVICLARYTGLHVSLLMQEFRQAAHDFDLGGPANSLVGNDRILQCALSQQLKQQQQDKQRNSPEQQLVAQGLYSLGAQSGVLILSNDKVMQLKVSFDPCVLDIRFSSNSLCACDMHVAFAACKASPMYADMDRS